jgi:integrase
MDAAEGATRDRYTSAGKLTALAVKKISKRGMHGDGHGLYLQVAQGGTKSWVLRFKINGRPRHFGLGPTHAVSLAQARIRAADARRLLLDGHDPIAARHAARAAGRLANARTMTFDECAEAYIKAHRAGWKNAVHAGQWSSTLQSYVSPAFGSLPAQAIDTALVMRVIEPLWTTKPETAGRVRGRIETILDWARVRGYRTGENPARWKGHLDHLLPARSKVRKVEHHAALPYAEIGNFMVELRRVDSVAARALEWMILTATRTSETINATWSEIDLDDAVWTIPGARMKGGKDHRVPLSDAALALLEKMQAIRTGDYVFPGRNGKPLSNMALLMVLRRMKRGHLTGHGFRSTFRVWCAEQTNFPSEVAEAALAHAVSDKAIAAYMRTTFFDRRRKLMQAWAAYCAQLPAAVVPIRLA